MQRLPFLLLLVSIALGASGCLVTSKGCTLILVEGLDVTVSDSRSGANVCNATVTAHDGAYTEILGLSPPVLGDAGTPTRCAYVGAGERAGHYTIEIAAPSHAAKTITADVLAGECHVTPAQPTVAIDPI